MDLPCRRRRAARLGRTIAVIAVIGSGAGRAADQNLDAVQTVCGRCHSTAVFLNKPRSWERWNDVFADMTQRGAAGTTELLARVTTYFLENLTILNINTSPVDEITGVLGVDDSVAAAIVARRQRQPFSTIAELAAIPGIDPRNLELRKSRILF